MYYDPQPAAAAVERLHGMGYAPDDISVMMNEKTRERAFGAMVKAKGSEGLATGATAGGVIGAVVAGIAATGAIVGSGGLAAPLVAGPLAAALAGLGAGAATGGIIGGLVGVGIGEKKAKEYEQGLKQGGILVAVRPKTEKNRDDVRRALAYDRPATRGDIGPRGTDSELDYAGETPQRRT